MSKSLAAGTRKPSVATCEGLCEDLVKGAASGDVKEAAGHVRPVWAEVDEDIS